MVINVPVANLRALPQAVSNDLRLPTSDRKNPLQLTQVLLGEFIIAQEEYINQQEQTWLRVQVPQQEFYKLPLGWHGFPGWIQKNQTIAVDTYPTSNLVVKNLLVELKDEEGYVIHTVSIGTRLNGKKINENTWQIILPDGMVAYVNDRDVYSIEQTVQESINNLRQSIVAKALEFVGSYYSWGGRSAQCEELFGISSVDCSALIHLSFLAHGLQLPRMSHEQFVRSHQIDDGKDLQPGDLVFFSSITKKSTRMDHVMMYLGDNQLLESTIMGEKKVRIVPFNERMCLPNDLLHSGDIIDCTEDVFAIFFGSFFKNTEMVQALRNDALKNSYA